VGTYCYVRSLHSAGAVGSAARGASAPTEGGEGQGHIVAAARLQLVAVISRLTLARIKQAQLMLTTGAMRLAVSRGQQT